MRLSRKAAAVVGAALLVLGAGCQMENRQAVSVPSGPQPGYETTTPSAPEQPDGRPQPVMPGDLGADASAAIDAALKESDADIAASMEETADAGLMNNDSSELNAYGQTYVESDYR